MIEKGSLTYLTNRERAWLNRAINLAYLSEMRQKHGAIVVKNNRAMGFGVNTHRNSPLLVDGLFEHCSVHAEINAHLAVHSKNVDGATMYVARVNRAGIPRLSRPCNRCYKYLLDQGYKKIVFTDN